MKTIYHYHPETGVFVELGFARESPQEPGHFFTPAYATELQPPAEPDGQVAVFEDGAWQLVTDNRGDWFNADRELVRVADPRRAVDGLVREAPPSAAHDLVDGVWVLNQERHLEQVQRALLGAVDARIEATAAAKGYEVARALARAGYPGPYQVECIAFAQWVDDQYQRCFEIRDKVLAGERPVPTEAELLAELGEMVWPQ